MKLTGAEIFLKMLELYHVKHVFGLPGETTLSLYKSWANFPSIQHILTHDERSASYMAEAYAKITGAVGICEAPSPGGTHPAPGILEAFKGSIPVICFTSDVPFNYDKRNMLSGFNQNRFYEAITKESLLVTNAVDMPYLIRRAFRIALSGRPGAVHVRIPMNIYTEQAEIDDLYADKHGNRWPNSRPIADLDAIHKAVDLLQKAKFPVLICGQGALVSDAGNTIKKFAEIFNIPVGCTTTAKGTISEIDPFSIRVVGARGGTSYSNKFIEKADLIFFVGSNTDSAGTDSWKLPNKSVLSTKIIHLDICGIEAGNNYHTDVTLIGDAKATLEVMLNVQGDSIIQRQQPIREIIHEAMEKLDSSIKKASISHSLPINPVRLVKSIESLLPKKSYIIIEPSIGSIFSLAYLVQKKPGRMFISNYSQGALGYVIPASLAASVASPDATIIGIGGDGSFHFNCGELETFARLNANIKYIVCKNDSYGWIRGEAEHVYHSTFWETDFSSVDYVKIAEGFGIKGFRITKSDDLLQVLEKVFSYKGPALIEVPVPNENDVVPPVPRWGKNAMQQKKEYYY